MYTYYFKHKTLYILYDNPQNSSLVFTLQSSALYVILTGNGDLTLGYDRPAIVFAENATKRFLLMSLKYMYN